MNKTNTTNKTTMLQQNRWIVLCYALVSTSIVAGVVYGWPAYRHQLIQEGTTLTESKLDLIFTIGSWSTIGGRFFFGLLRDQRKIGTRYTGILSLVCACIGSIGLGISHPNDLVSLCISMLLIGLGSGIQLCVQPIVALLFPQNQGVVMTSISGSFLLSGLIFLILTSIIHNILSESSESSSLVVDNDEFDGTAENELLEVEGGESYSSSLLRKVRTQVFIGYAIVVAILTVIASFILPPPIASSSSYHDDSLRTAVVDWDDVESGNTMKNANGDDDMLSSSSSEESDNDEEEDEEEVIVDGFASTTTTTTVTKLDVTFIEENIKIEPIETTEPLATTTTTTTTTTTITALEQMKSFEYIGLIAWFSVTLIPIQYYIATLGYQLELKFGHHEGYVYSNLFLYLYASAALFSPLGGKIADYYGMGVALGVASTLTSTSFFLLAASTSKEEDNTNVGVLVVGLIFHALGRMMDFGMFFTCLGKRFGYSNYGTLLGVGLLLSGTIALLQTPLIDYATSEKSTTLTSALARCNVVNNWCGIMLLCLLPYCIWLGLKEKREWKDAIKNVRLEPTTRTTTPCEVHDAPITTNDDDNNEKSTFSSSSFASFSSAPASIAAAFTTDHNTKMMNSSYYKRISLISHYKPPSSEFSIKEENTHTTNVPPIKKKKSDDDDEN